MKADQSFDFPFQAFRSAAAFSAYKQSSQALLDLRYGYETARADAAEGRDLLAPGSCGLCLHATSFATRLPDRTASPGAQPNWREEMTCGCVHRLNNRFRALLHFITLHIDPPAWTRILLLGAAAPIEAWLQQRVTSIAVRARSGRLLRAPLFEPHSYHLILSCEHLHAEPELDAVLIGLRDALVPGGRLVFTAPFDTASPTSRLSDAGGGVLGWDVLDRLTRAGFHVPAAHLYWSEEFGYLGPFNLLFTASC